MPPEGLIRTPNAVVTASVIDRARRELYVEGWTDVALILWLAGPTRDPHVLIAPISEVKMEAQEGGEKGRLLALARTTQDEARVICFVDADHDRVLGISHPPNVVLTDGTDAEGYALEEQCISRVLLLGVQSTKVSGQDVLDAVLGVAREIALLRYVQRRYWKDLPVNSVRLTSVVKARHGQLAFDFAKLLRCVVSNCGGKPSLPEVLERLAEAKSELATVPDKDLVRGHDVMAILGEVLLGLKVCREDAPTIVRTAIDAGCLARNPNLDRIVRFVQGQSS